ncbi:MAG: sigma-54 dependent transcriptional regulator [Armatimonadota bacterium]|nr:sigma-54 dependent transcriptional regulator [Armatimonadota bacterium]
MSSKYVLVIDDEEGIRTVLADLFGEMGWHVCEAKDGKSGLDLALSEDFDLIILDLSLPRLDGLALLRKLRESKPDVPVIIITGYATMKSAIEALKLGAFDYVTKPFDLSEVQIIAQHAVERQRLIYENRYLKNELRQRHGFDNVIGLTKKVQKAYILAAKVADSNASVLILGETGVGKEYLARAIHYQSARADGPFVKVSCAALPEALLESELFGHEKGAFTGAIARRIGRFEMADGGTLFLDEIGDITPATQVKLLRVLQEKQFERVGGSETISVDVRIIAATNKDLKKAIANKEFREDLYYRLNVITINLPPLRERVEDIPELVRHFIAKYNSETGKSIEGISPEGIAMLQNYQWPGNIRELENCIERAVILCHGRTILPQHILLSEENVPFSTPAFSSDGMRSLKDVEKEHIANVLAKCNWNQSRAASILGIDRKTLRNKIREYGLGMEIAGSNPDYEQ